MSGFAGGTFGAPAGGNGEAPQSDGKDVGMSVLDAIERPAARRDRQLRRLDEDEARELAAWFEGAAPEELLRWAFDRFGDGVALVSSFQAEAMVLIDMAARVSLEARVLTIDTGRLPQQTYELIDEVRRRYGIRVEVLFPEARAVEAMVSRHGFNLFYESVPNRLMCCHVRKVQPLQRALAGLDAWVTGLRREHSDTRARIHPVAVDREHGGITKISPLAGWTEAEVWDYLRDHDVPTHRLYEEGYTSIGCAPCTRPADPGADARSGRWWWESTAPKECGMHCSLESGRFERELIPLLSNAA